MCGIAGYFGRDAESRASWMTCQLAHRGPDDEGVWVSGRHCVALGNRRLKILDLSPQGHQPMRSHCGRWTLTFNGEIFNFVELREELRGLGHSFQSQTDTEVLLAALIEWGPSAIRRLSGMFALGLWDEETGTLLLARDPLGIKPIYHTEKDGEFAFASEISALLASEIREPLLDPRGLESFLRLLWVPEPQTLFSEIYKLAPGHLLTWDGARMLIQQYWDLPAPDPLQTDPIAARDRVTEALETAVRQQLRSDVPVGAFLSGGLDSTTVLSLAAQAGTKSIRSYAIGFASTDRTEEGASDDLRYARLVAESLEIPHREIILSPDVMDLLPRMVRHLEDPVADPAAINCFLICQAARETSTVLLSGTGGDELFGGYRKYPFALLGEDYQRIPGPIRSALIEPLARRLPVAVGRTGLRSMRFAKKFLQYGSSSLFDRFLGYSSYYDAPELEELLGGDPEGAVDPYIGVRPLQEAWERRDTGQTIDRMTYVDLKYYLPGLGLAYMDKASMAASVEVRVPLLDQHVVEVVARLPDQHKVQGLRTKLVLREAMRGRIPDVIIRRPKAPFAAPIRSWLRRDVAPMVAEFLSPGQILRRGFLNPAVAHRILREHRQGLEDHSLRIWALLTLEVWLQEFCDNRARFKMPPDFASTRVAAMPSEA